MTGGQRGLPERIGRYEVYSLLGRGGMGRVLLCHDPVLKREVAIKLVDIDPIEAETSGELRYMFHREARATAALRHPGIIEVYDYSGPDAEILFLACERLEGPSLREVLERRKQLAAALVAALGYEVAEALAHAHTAGIIHRDVKPENIFWLESGRVVLSDFGIAKALDGSGRLGQTVRFGATNVYGSPAYMAPEQLSDGAVGPHTDLHALGAVLYEALTGRQAFAGPDINSILEAVQSDGRPSLEGATRAPRVMTELIHQMLAKEPACRPASAREVAGGLRQALDALEVADPRVVLRDGGGEVVLHQPSREEDEATELYTTVDDGIHVRDPSHLISRSRWAALASRGPVVLGMLGFALLIGAAAYLFVNLSELPLTEDFFPAPIVSTDPAKAPTVADTNDIFVLIRFPGSASVWVDGQKIGRWDNQVRLGLSSGRHQLEVSFTSGRDSREVILLPDTSPVFDFAPPPPREH